MNIIRKTFERITKTVGPRTEIDEMTSGALILQGVFGQQVLDPNWAWKRFFLHHSFNVFLFVYTFFGTLETLRNTTNIELRAKAYYTLVMIFIFPTKLLLFINNRTVFRDLYLSMKTTLIDTIERDGKSNKRKVIAKAKKIVHMLYAMVVVPVVNMQLMMLWNYLNGNRSLLSPSTSILMPMTSPYFEIGWILHTIFVLELCTTIVMDMWFVLLIYVYCAASDSLVKTLEVKKEDDSQFSYEERLHTCLKKFHKDHVKQVRFLMTLNKMYEWFALIPLCNAAVCICIILLLLSKEMDWNFAPHFMPMFAEVFAYNWFGEQIKTKATSMNVALINFDWTSLWIGDKKSYYVIISYAKKEFGIKTAIGNYLSLITMSAVLKASYQAFTVLQSVGD